MNLLVFQHIDCEHPGILRDFLKQDGIEWHAVELDAGDPIPALDRYDALWVMGGPMDVWDVAQNPWMIAEKQAIRKWVNDLNKPFLGLCLGHQLLADALGGTCGPQTPPEIGVMEVELTEEGNQTRFSRICRSPVNVCNGIRFVLPSRRKTPPFWLLPTFAVCRRCGSVIEPGPCSIMSRSSRTRSATGVKSRLTGRHWKIP